MITKDAWHGLFGRRRRLLFCYVAAGQPAVFSAVEMLDQQPGRADRAAVAGGAHNHAWRACDSFSAGRCSGR